MTRSKMGFASVRPTDGECTRMSWPCSQPAFISAIMFGDSSAGMTTYCARGTRSEGRWPERQAAPLALAHLDELMAQRRESE